MSKSLLLGLATCLSLTGCQLFHRSPTWHKVVHARIPVSQDEDASKTYAQGLHRELKAERVEHKVVTYQYRYRSTSRLREDVTFERTAVIYRDDTNAKHPWWLKDQTRLKPVWLPNGSLEQQLRFYIGRDVEVLSPEGWIEGKGVVPHHSVRAKKKSPVAHHSSPAKKKKKRS